MELTHKYIRAHILKGRKKGKKAREERKEESKKEDAHRRKLTMFHKLILTPIGFKSVWLKLWLCSNFVLSFSESASLFTNIAPSSIFFPVLTMLPLLPPTFFFRRVLLRPTSSCARIVAHTSRQRRRSKRRLHIVVMRVRWRICCCSFEIVNDENEHKLLKEVERKNY